MNRLDPIRELLAKGGRKAVAEALASYEEITFNEQLLSEDCAGLLVFILSDERLYSAKGVEQFILHALLDIDRMSERQRAEFWRVVEQSYASYEEEPLCLVLADWVARNCPPSVGVAKAEALLTRSRTAGKYAILVALDVIGKRVSDDKLLSARVLALRQSAER
jgi:hypothetical protein